MEMVTCVRKESSSCWRCRLTLPRSSGMWRPEAEEAEVRTAARACGERGPALRARCLPCGASGSTFEFGRHETGWPLRSGSLRRDSGVVVLGDVAPIDLSKRKGEMLASEAEGVEGRRAGTQKKHRCPQCGKAFATPSHLRTHARTHSGSKPFRCPDCTAAFAQSNNLRRHLRTHTRERPYKCTHCDCAFRDSSHLQRHRLLHTGERPFHCNTCGTSFAQSNTLRDHLRLHTGERPFACTLCPEAFVRRSHLTAHCQRIHGSTALAQAPSAQIANEYEIKSKKETVG